MGRGGVGRRGEGWRGEGRGGEGRGGEGRCREGRKERFVGKNFTFCFRILHFMCKRTLPYRRCEKDMHLYPRPPHSQFRLQYHTLLYFYILLKKGSI